ncbi:MAG: glycosyltransferase [Syntrophobacterales bacterium]|nr:glycosyltransferase [Syntrophobacterales bacterium]
MKKLALIYVNYGPYHLARLKTTARLGKEQGVEVVGLELASKEAIRDWRREKSPGIELLTVFPDRVAEEIPPLELARGTWAALERLNPQAIALGLNRETFPATAAALAWKRQRRRVAIIMMVSKYDDYPRHPMKEWVKKRLMGLYDAALVSGHKAKEYAAMLGMPPERIFLGCDVVDNDHFARGAAQARDHVVSLRDRYGLPENYFLYVGRFDEKKNVSGLLQAYHHYVIRSPADPWSLVLCGSGPLETRLRREVQDLNLSGVVFAGFRQVEELPIFYGLAQAFIMPSSHSEQWGLVVNEAMASGLPVLVSKACGCARDLVQEGVNGFTFDPYDVEGLARLILMMSSGEVDLGAMGEASRQIIANWTPEVFAENLFKAIEAAIA